MEIRSKIIDGRAIAEQLLLEVKDDVAALELMRITPGLAVVQVGEDPSSTIYVNNKIRAAKSVGIHSFVYKLDEHCTVKHLKVKIEHLNNDPKIHGILVQLPLPKSFDSNEIINTISPEKDVDGLTIQNVGLLVTKQDGLVPCTPQGCLHLIKTVLPKLSGLNAVIIGRSNIVGRPMANVLLNEDCTVTHVHSKTINIAEICQKADIIVVAVGSPKFLKASWVKEGAVIIDVGISREDASKKLIGDADFEQLLPIVKAITPVPGGVGPMTIACLLKNTVKAVLNLHHLIKVDSKITKKPPR